MREAAEVWENFYLSKQLTHDVTRYHSLKNTFGISLLEGFHKYAKFGLAAYITHELRSYTQNPDSIPHTGPDRPEDLTPYPFERTVDHKGNQNLVWVGGQLTKQQGSILRYEATARFGIMGDAAGDLMAEGKVQTRWKLANDSVFVTGKALFSNEMTPYLMNNYVSNNFIWHNSFGKTRRLRFGGELFLKRTSTHLSAGVENIQNLLYFGEDCMPRQAGNNIQLVNFSLLQNFRVGVLNWDNRLTYQTSTDNTILPLPKFAIYSNLYLLFKVAKVLHVQFGIDCDYYTRYYAPAYQPATMSFCNQRSIMVGNYPFMNLYVNMKLSKARFYVMMTHVNQGVIGGNNYFSLPHYPLNPRRFQMGVSVDFSN